MNSEQSDWTPANLGSSPESETLSGLKILVAEPSHDIGNLVRIHLLRRGASVQVVEDGQAVLNQVLNTAGQPTADAFDLILMEIHLPKVDGIITTQRLRSAGYRRPIVAFTTSDTVTSVRESRRLGFDTYLAKPYLAAELTSCIRDTVDLNGQPAPEQ